MSSETCSVTESPEGSVVLASFDSNRRAEHMLASLGRSFHVKARKGTADAVVVSDNRTGR